MMEDGDRRRGDGAAQRHYGIGAVMSARGVLTRLAGLLLLVCTLAACSSAPSARYPFPKMTDPVTEQVPNVKVK